MWFGVGLRVQGSTGSGSLREGGLGSASGRIGSVLVGVDLVVATILSGPRHRVGLGLRGEVLGVPCRRPWRSATYEVDLGVPLGSCRFPVEGLGTSDRSS